jgi:hypothetical protein
MEYSGEASMLALMNRLSTKVAINAGKQARSALPSGLLMVAVVMAGPSLRDVDGSGVASPWTMRDCPRPMMVSTVTDLTQGSPLEFVMMSG